MAFVGAIFTIEMVFGHSSQPQASKTGAPGENNCTQCHSGTLNSGTGGVSLVFNGGVNQYVQGTTYPITVTVTDATHPRFGFQVTALSGGTGPTRGTFVVINSTNTSAQSANVGGNPRTYMGHKNANTNNTWTFNWTAPTNISSPITFYVCGNATNNAGNTSGDKVYTSTVTITMAPPPAPVAAFTANNTSICPGTTVTFTDQSTGTIDSRSWSFPGGFPATSTLANPMVTYPNPGTYTVTEIVTNLGGSDTLVQTNMITVNSNPTLSATTSAVLCQGSNTGSINLSVMGTTGNTFNWSNSSTQEDLSGLAAGSYSVTVTSGAGCTSTGSYTVPNATPLLLSMSSQLAGCTVANGSATATASGGAGSFSYLWSNGGTTASISGLASGTYIATLTDGNGCSTIDSVTVGTTPNPTLSTTSTATNCGQSTGVVSVTPSGGVPGYSFLWDNAATTATVSGIPAGAYAVTVTDANGCTASASATVDNADGPSLTSLVSTVSCFGGNNGGIALSVNSGVPPFQYSWSTGDTSANIAGLIAGTYSTTVTDSTGCFSVLSITVGELAAIVPNLSFTPDNGIANGSATANPFGGNGFYTYAWSNGGTTATITGLSLGTYFVTVTDPAGCTAVDSIEIPFAVGTENGFAGVKVSPVPFSDLLKVQLGDWQGTELNLRIIDLQGRVHLQQSWASAPGEALSFGTQFLAAGVYFLELEGNGRREVIRLMKGKD